MLSNSKKKMQSSRPEFRPAGTERRDLNK